MRLAIFNGSPRAKSSNTGRLMGHFIEGFRAVSPDSTSESFYLMGRRDFQLCVDAFSASDAVILAFPLYTDAMPAAVKEFIEALAPLRGAAEKKNPPLGFIVHSGFQESFHSHAVRAYLEKLCRRLGCEYLGCAIAGGSEAIRSQPDKANQGFFGKFRRLGEAFGRTGKFDQAVVEEMGRPIKFGMIGRLMGLLWGKLGDILYWDKLLKENGVFDRRLDRPYGKS